AEARSDAALPGGGGGRPGDLPAAAALLLLAAQGVRVRGRRRADRGEREWADRRDPRAPGQWAAPPPRRRRGDRAARRGAARPADPARALCPAGAPGRPQALALAPPGRGAARPRRVRVSAVRVTGVAGRRRPW